MPSNKILKAKQAVAAEIAEDFKTSLATVFVSTRGLTVEEDTEIRNELRKAGVKFVVRKNSLAEKAAESLNIEGLEEYLKGPTAIATSTTSYTDAAKILCKYAAKLEEVTVKGGIFEGKAITAEEVKELSKIPTREELLARLVGALNSPIAGLAIVLNKVAEKQQEGAEA